MENTKEDRKNQEIPAYAGMTTDCHPRESGQYHSHPRTLVYQYEKIKLYHYQSKQKTTADTIPTLIVFATINRPEILDLAPERSFIGNLLAQGVDVYLLDWGYPDFTDKQLKLENYVINYLRRSILFIRNNCNSKINLIGICQGGVISLCYSLLYPEINKLTLISTPIDFQTKENTIYHLLKNISLNNFLNFPGNIPGVWLTQFFISLRPFELIGKKYLSFFERCSDPAWTEKFLNVEKWIYDAPDQPKALFSEFVKDFYTENKLIKGQIFLLNKRIDLRQLKIPTLNIMASEDEIVPPSASQALIKYIAKKYYKEKIFPSGHIGIYISDKVGESLSNEIALWLKT